MEPIVTFCISTCSGRVLNIRLPNQQSAVKYIIVYQPLENDSVDFEDSPWHGRKDVKVIVDEGMGLSRSRNIGIEHVDTHYFMIMDDDVQIYVDKVLELIRRMQVEVCDVGTCTHLLENGRLPAKYRARSFSHNLISAASVSSIDICCRTNSVRECGVLFNERFGLGTDLPSGEEYIFIATCIKMGLRVKFFPLACSLHPDLTSGADFFTERNKVKAKREMLKEIFGRLSGCFIVMFWLKKSAYVAKSGYFITFTKNLLFK